MVSHVSRGALALASILILGAGPAPEGREEPPIGRGVGKPVPDFRLRDARTGSEVSLHDVPDQKAAVIVVTGTECPVGNLYMPRLVELADAYRAKGVVFLAINANAHESAAEVARHAEAHKLPFPVLKDEGNVVADRLLVVRTCEALVVDAQGTLRYRGAIDDQYGLGTRRERPTTSYLVAALDAILDGREVETTASSVVGCPIDRLDARRPEGPKPPRVRPAPPEVIQARQEFEKDEPTDVGHVTYAGEVAPIIREKCQGCHRPGQVGPFSLLDYDDARRWSASIAEVVEDRRMPPWHADPRFGRFTNDRSLNGRERATLLAWVEQGSPLGDPKRLPPLKSYPEGWTIGTPDLVFEMPEVYTVAAEGTLPYQFFRVPTNFKEDVWVQAAEARPGDRSVVHHIIVSVAEPKTGNRRRGEREHFCAYAPGDLPSTYGPGIAKRIPAGSDLVFEVHYTPTGTIREDRSAVALILAKGPVQHEAFTRPIANLGLKIPPGDPNFEVRAQTKVKEDAHLLTLFPHMHLRGKDFRFTAVYPDGRREVLLSVPAYDFGWQSSYRLAEPRAIPKGTVIECVAHYDNSAGNPYNPDPTKTVRWGPQTWHEMMIGYIDYVNDRPQEGNSSADDADERR